MRELSGCLECAAGDSQSLGGDSDPAAIQGMKRDLESLPFIAKEAGRRNENIIEKKLSGGGCL